MKSIIIKALSRFKTQKKLNSCIPGFVTWDQRKEALQKVIEPHHQFYIQKVSNERSAISLETAVMLAFLCELKKPTRILDVGSGFSSFIFRSYQKTAGKPVEVVSLDNDALWLDKTRQYLASAGLSLDGVMEFDHFLKIKNGKFDIALHDLGNLDERKKHLRTVLDLAHKDSVIVLDDFHKQHYRENIQQQLSDLEIDHISLCGFTLDKFSRYAAVIAGVPESIVI